MRRTYAIVATLVLLAPALAPRTAGAYGEATFGTQWWTQNEPEAKFQEFRDVPQGAFLESFLLRGGDPKWKTTFWGANALRKDELLGLNLSRGVRWQLDGRWRQIPHNISQVSRTGYAEVAPGVFVLPDTLQARNQADAGGYVNRMRDYLNTAHGIGVGFRTDIGSARLRARPSNGWLFELKAERRDRSGEKPYGATFGFSNAVEVVEPINQQIWNGEASANYQRGRMALRFAGGYSSFDNRVDVLRWDNPQRLTDSNGASGHGLLDLYPDNHALKGSAGVVLRLPKAATFSANVGASRLTQNDRWQPFTINSAIPDSALQLLYTSSARSTDAKAVRLNADTRLAGRVVGDLHGALRFRWQRYDNQTPEHAFRGIVPYDNAIDPASAIADSVVRTVPYGNEQKTIGADADYALSDRVQLDGTVEERLRTHTHREVEKDKEFYARVRTGIEATSDVHLELAAFQGIRVLDQFEVDDYYKAENPDSVLTELVGLRRFDVANRHQRGVSAGLDVAATDRLDLAANAGHTRNRYPDSVYGLRAEEINELLGQVSYKLSKRVDVSGGYGKTWTSTDQQSNETNASPPPTSDAVTDWTARIHDRNDYAFANIVLRPRERISMALGYVFSRDQADYHLLNGAGTAQNLPDTFYRRHDASFDTNYRLRGGTELGLRYRFEQYDVVDFASQGIQLLGLTGSSATAIYLGDNSLPYHAHVVSFVATRRF